VKNIVCQLIILFFNYFIIYYWVDVCVVVSSVFLSKFVVKDVKSFIIPRVK
jgi:hypothetical protein